MILRLSRCRIKPTDEDRAVTTEALMRLLASGPTIACGKTGSLLRASSTDSLEQHLSKELHAFRACAATDDFVERVSAFIEKRTVSEGT
jgi:enoyl-CoA hydratase/carnithine racemase